MTEPRPVPLSSIPDFDLLRVSAMFRPTLVVGAAQRMGVIVPIPSVIAVGARQQTQAT
jgi:hypothetical protein